MPRRRLSCSLLLTCALVLLASRAASLPRALAATPCATGGRLVVLSTDPDPMLHDCSISGNTFAGNGGGVENHGTLTLTNVVISGNTATGGCGGGIYNDGTLTLNNVTVTGNTATATTTRCYSFVSAAVRPAAATTGGGSTSASGFGGGIYNGGTVYLSGGSIGGTTAVSGNHADADGGGLYNSGSADMSGVVIQYNRAGGNGGGIYNGGSIYHCTSPGGTSPCDLASNLTISNNNATGNGGGSYNASATATYKATTIAANHAGGSGGGSFTNNGTVELLNVTISGNSATLDGGGIEAYSGSDCCPSTTNLYDTNVTIVGNSAGRNGGGVDVTGGFFALLNGSISDNHAAGNGNGIYTNTSASGTSELLNTVLARNPTAGPPVNCGNAISADDGYNLDTGNSCGFSAGAPKHDLVSVGDATVGLGTLSGTPPQTEPLLAGSPAIGQGSPSNQCYPTDERGAPRNTPNCDIGAYDTGGNGGAASGGTISGVVSNGGVAGASPPPTPAPIAGAIVGYCRANGECGSATTGADGKYSIHGLPAGTYALTVSAPTATPPACQPESRSVNSLALDGNATLTQNFTLYCPPPPPPSPVTPSRGLYGNTPIVYWTDVVTFTAHGCVGGSASYGLVPAGESPNQHPIGPVTMTETPAGSGTYLAGLPPTADSPGPEGVSGTIFRGYTPVYHGLIHVTYTVTCGGIATITPFDIYVDPSGLVVNQNNQPIAGARVTLLRSDMQNGPYTPVPNGSAIMSSSNRVNPDTTDASGHFGWDVIPGWYKVLAASCGASSTQGPFQIPPPVTNLKIQLTCPVQDSAPPEARVQLQLDSTHSTFTLRVSPLANASGPFLPVSPPVITDVHPAPDRDAHGDHDDGRGARQFTYSLQDQAGNRSVLKLVERGNDNGLTVQLLSIQYNDGTVMTFPDNRLEFEWHFDKETGKLKALEQHLSAGKGDSKVDLQSHYEDGKQDQTKIDVNLPKHQKDQHLTEPGTVLGQVNTSSGQISFSDGNGHTWP